MRMCKYNRLYIWVEGRRDKQFFEKVIKPKFEREYGRGRVHIRQYREMGDEKVASLIESFKAKDDDCICVADINSAPCVSKRKEEKQKEEFKNVDKDRIMIVIREIESWYLAGLDEDACKRLGITEFDNTDKITKARFDSLWRKSRDSDVDFMQEILKSFDIETAKRKNTSFGYFVEKYDP